MLRRALAPRPIGHVDHGKTTLTTPEEQARHTPNLAPIALEADMRFALREGGRVVGAVTKVQDRATDSLSSL